MVEKSKVIVDQHIRDAIKSEISRSVVVEASAGTGKTTLLTDRVCAMVEHGINLESMAVVTFTEAAAGELRERIRSKLRPDLRKKMDQAWIHTIHGFASRILREYYHLTGGIPSFSTETSHFSRAEMEILWDLFLAEATPEELKDATDALRNPGSEILLDAAVEMEKHRWLTNSTPLGNIRETINDDLRKWKSRLRELAGLCSSRSDKLLLQIETAICSLDHGDLNCRLNLRNGSQTNWGGKQGRDEVIAELKTFRANLKNLSAMDSMLSVMPAVDNLVIPFLNRIRARWDSDPSRYSFEDLLYKAEASVFSSQELRNQLGEKFSYIFIDEFQDTSLVQVNLFRAILESSGLSSKLTVVGDPKQSIYGWRSADIETYMETVKELENADALSETISVNFRSSVSIINFINSFGKALFQNASPEEAPFSSSYSPIEPAPDAVIGDGVFVHRYQGKTAEEKAGIEAAGIVELIRDPGSTAVLFRTKTHIDALLKELDAHSIPYRVEAGRDFHKRPEVKDMAVLLRYLLSPGDHHAEIHTLRSMFFGINDREITIWIRSGRESESILKAHALLNDLRERITRYPPGIFMRTLLRNTCLLNSIRLSGYQTGRRLSNIRFILELAENSQDYSLLLETLEGLAPVSTDEPSAPPERGDSAVTISTIHSAKGLAWDHVILASPGNTFPGISHKVLVNRRKKEMGLRLKNALSAQYPRLLEMEKHRRMAEYRRLLYVAVTRPRRRLDLFLPSGAGETSPVAFIETALVNPDLYTEHVIDPVELPDVSYAREPDLKETPGEPFTDLFSFSLPEQETEQSRDLAMRLGTEVHRIMEFIDLKSPFIWLEENREMLETVLEFPGRAAELAGKFFKLFPIGDAVVKGREYPILTETQTLYVDLLLERNGILEAVDYKTDTSDIRERTEFYRPHQIDYQRELKKTTGKEVKTFLVFLHHGEIIEIE